MNCRFIMQPPSLKQNRPQLEQQLKALPVIAITDPPSQVELTMLVQEVERPVPLTRAAETIPEYLIIPADTFNGRRVVEYREEPGNPNASHSPLHRANREEYSFRLLGSIFTLKYSP